MKPQISFAITVCNETIEIQQLVRHLRSYADLSQNELVILVDKSKAPQEVLRYCQKLQAHGVKVKKDIFSGNFADWKNNLRRLCRGKYIFHIDADEIPNSYLTENIGAIIESNKHLDIIWVPRENYVEGISEQDRLSWGWSMDEKGRINFPDYQSRIFRNCSNIKWQNKVHEQITGSDKQAGLPAETRFSLLHRKTIEKQMLQMAFYRDLQS